MAYPEQLAPAMLKIQDTILKETVAEGIGRFVAGLRTILSRG